VQQFSKVFVVEEKSVAPETGRALRLGLELRNKARYDPHARLTESEARARGRAALCPLRSK